ncbi:cyclin-L2-like [Dendronephthya gigantea]|uniref:cyclin-L2-like n=1 Tax=Dendronephthya gigantea TaxID=151771 RepID=UPI00106B3D84|nr:cyclin-L2-like [Dendronephthya gigantea]
MASARGKVYDYGNVEISLENCVIPAEKLEKTPSASDGLSTELETEVRIVGCEYIQTGGILLKLPQVAMATGQVLFQRFYYSKSLIRHDVEVYAMACLFLAAKIEESPRRIRDVINVFHHIKQRRNMKPIAPMEYMGNIYFALKNLVIKAERRILKELGFCVHIKHPHKVVITFLQVLECEKNQQLAQKAWNYMNDALRTNVFVRYQPETIACACISLSARQLQIPLPSRPPWWELFDSTMEDIEDVCVTLLKLYQRPKISLHTLNIAVGRLKKAKKITESATSANDNKLTKKTSGDSFSRPGSPSANPSPLCESSKSRSEDVKKNGVTKSESQEARASGKKSGKSLETRKDNGKSQKATKRARSPGSDKSHSSSGTGSESDDGTGSDSDSGNSGSSHEDRRKRRIARRENRDNRRENRGNRREDRDNRRDRRLAERLSRRLQKSKSDTNANRRPRERSRSPHRRSRSRSRDRRNANFRDKHVRRAGSRDSRERNGDYRVSDERERREAR